MTHKSWKKTTESQYTMYKIKLGNWKIKSELKDGFKQEGEGAVQTSTFYKGNNNTFEMN
jgi:hypothetical protein